MATKKLNPDTGRQYPLVALQAINFADLTAGTAVPLTKLPRGARIIAARLQVDKSFGAAITLELGDAGNATRYGAALALSAVGNVAITTTLAAVTEPVITGKVSAAVTAGNAVLFVEYVLPDRANEVQP